MNFLYSVIALALAPVLVAAPFNQPGDPQTIAAAQLALHTTVVNNGIDIQVTDEAGSPVRDAAIIVRLPDEGPSGQFSNGTRAQVAYTDSDGHAHVDGIQWQTGPGTVPVQVTVTKGEAHAGTIVEHALAAPLKHEAKVTPPPAASPSQPAAVARKDIQPPALTSPATQTAQAPDVPRVSVISHPTDQKISSGSHKKWIILALVVGAGAGAAFAMGGKKSSSSSSSSTSGTTIGAPTVSVGQP